MSEARVRVDNVKLDKAYEMLSEAVEAGGFRPYKTIEVDFNEKLVVIEDIEGRWVRIPISYVPVLMLDLMRLYYSIRNQYREMLRKFETGVWE
jgi:hypothetical protein